MVHPRSALPLRLVARFFVSSALLLVAPNALAAETPAGPPVAAPTRNTHAVADAIALRQAGDLQGAAKRLIAHLDAQPFDARAHHELGVLYAATGQWEAAEARLSQAAALAPDVGATRLVLADVLRANLRCLRAIGLYQNVRLVPDLRISALRGLVLCQVAAADLPAADAAATELQAAGAEQKSAEDAAWATEKRRYLASLQKEGDLTPLQLETQGRALFDAGRFAEAATWLGWAVDKEPTADRAYRLAIALAAGDQLAPAVAALNRALALEPTHVPAKAALAPILRALRLRGHGQVVEFGAAGPGAEPADAQLARAMLDGDLVLAKQLLAALIRVDSGSGSAPVAAGTDVPASLPQAARDARGPSVSGSGSGSGSGPGSGSGLRLQIWSAELFLRDSQYPKAGQVLRDLVGRQPTHAAVRKLQAELALRQGRSREARELAGLSTPAEGSGEQDLQIWSQLRREEADHHLRMFLDPGLRPLPPLAERVQEALAAAMAARAAEVAALEAQAAEAAAQKAGPKGKSGKAGKSTKPAKRTGR